MYKYYIYTYNIYTYYKKFFFLYYLKLKNYAGIKYSSTQRKTYLVKSSTFSR